MAIGDDITNEAVNSTHDSIDGEGEESGSLPAHGQCTPGFREKPYPNLSKPYPYHCARLRVRDTQTQHFRHERRDNL